MSDLSDLIKRLEAASEPSQELDCAVLQAVNLGSEWRPSAVVEGTEWLFAPGGTALCCGSPDPLTASLDAALALVPDDVIWIIHKDDVGSDGVFFQANLLHLSRSAPPTDGGHPTSAAIALLIALLRMMETSHVA